MNFLITKSNCSVSKLLGGIYKGALKQFQNKTNSIKIHSKLFINIVFRGLTVHKAQNDLRFQKQQKNKQIKQKTKNSKI